MATTSYASVHDIDPREGVLTYFGLIKDIIELSFNEGCRKIVLFECDWADNNMNKIDKHGFTLVDFTRPKKKTCVTPRSRGYGDVTATYIRRSEIPSRIYAKHQYRQESEYGSMWYIIHSNICVQLQSYHQM